MSGRNQTDAECQGLQFDFNVPLDGYDRSGNMVGVPGDEKNTFNIMEMSGVDDNFFKMLNIPIVQGSFFTERNDSCRQVIIDERGAEKLIKRGIGRMA